jgi:hypothetical protein
VYYQGLFYWAGDWSDIVPNYASNASTGSLGVDGVYDSIMIPAGTAYEYWLPYPPLTAGSPAGNGIGCNLTGKTMMTIAIKPTQAGLQPTIGFYKANATTVDIAFGNQVNIANAAYGPATPVVGQWNVYTIPLSAFGIGTPGWIYKFILQEQGTTPQQMEVDQVGFY